MAEKRGVDDNPGSVKAMKRRLEAVGYQVITPSQDEKPASLPKTGVFDFSIPDSKINGHDQTELLVELHQEDSEKPVIILTGYGTTTSEARFGEKEAPCRDTKPCKDEPVFMDTKGGPGKKGLSKAAASPKGTVRERQGFKNIIAQSERMEKVFEQASLATESDSNVYVQGESGTGKELIARALHEASSRKDGPFVAINCAAIPETLLESELFGYQKGAFTGAAQDKEGLLGRAHGGTFLLDEISEMPLSMQAKFLRVLQEKEFFPVGGTKTRRINARIIATSNRNLEHEVRKGNFRKDLFYRIHVIVIQLPPLRERKEDIPLLASHFLKKFSGEMQKEMIGFSPAALRKLTSHAWPGNVRELENIIESAVAMTTQNVIPGDLILPTQDFKKERKENNLKPLKEAKERFERDYLLDLIELTQGNVTQAAKLAGKYRADLYELMKKHDIKPADYRQGFH
ncbi:MAG: sigma-54 dependent transcriptional regulator [Thermodesulfobacteriota bacterium]|nr:sigma-54 dependent transcriptional regulator [Thermodesulfobacteriota bacterium]